MIEAVGITKKFGLDADTFVVANDGVHLSVAEGEIHGIVGENGAGKSTLMKILYGMLTPDAGELRLRGKPVHFSSPLDALKAGIGMVHQHFMLVERLSVLENLILGAEPMKAGIFLSENEALVSLRALEKEVNAELRANVESRQLAVGQQQRLEILKLLYRKSDCLIFDEPTGVLTPQEGAAFLKLLIELKKKGKTVLLITHKLNEVLSVADRITVMRAGKSVVTVNAKDVDQRSLAQLMVGKDVRVFGTRLERLVHENQKQPLLRARKIEVRRSKSVEFEIFRGEILGVAGVEGNGQRELSELIWGRHPLKHGSLLFEENEIGRSDIPTRSALGISIVPEDRHRDGLILDMTLTDNFYLGRKPHYKNKVFMPFVELEKEVAAAIREFQIKAKNVSSLARHLSGGNQQKLVMARALAASPKLLIAVQPTRGVDMGAAELLHDELIKRRNAGMSILLVSCELDELLALSDRLIVMREGEISARFDDLSIDRESLKYKIGEAML